MIDFIKNVALIFLIFVLLLVATNLAAWKYLIYRLNSQAVWSERVEIDASSRRGIQLRQEILGTTEVDYLNSLEDAPLPRSHPVLQFTSGLSTEQYTVGLEGIRYLPDWDDDRVRSMLLDPDAAYVFGGSTTFGHGVPDGDTVVAYLNRLDPDRPWLNFGVNAHDSIRETDKLLHLLRQGYRPAHVVFVDGLNDLTTFMASPYRTADKPRTQGFLIDRGDPALLFGTPVPPKIPRAFAYSFPVVHLFFYLTQPESTVEYGSLDANKVPIDYRTLSWHYKNMFKYARPNIEAIKSDWTGHYRDNIDFVRELGETFGFRASFIFQPIGYMEPANPFLTERYRGSQIWAFATEFSDNAATRIEDGTLAMTDCQSAFSDVDKKLAFVDATHYSPLGNRAMAQCILEAVNDVRAAPNANDR